MFIDIFLEHSREILEEYCKVTLSFIKYILVKYWCNNEVLVAMAMAISITAADNICYK